MASDGEPNNRTHILGYAEFANWYDIHRKDVLDPAAAIALAALNSVITDQLSDRDLTRIRLVTGRVKSKPRTWRKLHQPRYAGRITSVNDIPEVIDDLIGLRITCVNLRDIEMVQEALDSLPKGRVRDGRLWIDASSRRDYVASPKESGYRGWHVNLGIVINADGRHTAVTCELQVRTLLEDSWGELTHEDTYSKDGNLPPLVEVLSRRMADLLSTLDDIAEDLRTELDRIDDLAVAERADAGATTEASMVPTEEAADAAAVLLDRWRNLDVPVDLASLAWALQREFGAEVSEDWFGQRSFKRFLRYAVPEGEISSGDRGYLLPAGYDVDTAIKHDESEHDEALVELVHPDDDAISTIPKLARQLRRIDRGFPLIESSDWVAVYQHLAAAWRRFGTRKPTMRMINQLSRSARDQAATTGAGVSRRHLDYVAKAVLTDDSSGEPLDADAIAAAFSDATVERMTELKILAPRHTKNRETIHAWLNPQ